MKKRDAPGVEEPRPFPWAAACTLIALLFGAALAIGGVYILAGGGWAMVAASAPCFLLAAVLLRGLTRG